MREPKVNEVDPLMTPLSPAVSRLKLSKQQLPVKIFHAKETSAQAYCKDYILYDSKCNKTVRKVSSPVLCSAPTTWLLDCISVFSIVDVRDEHEIKDTVSASQG